MKLEQMDYLLKQSLKSARYIHSVNTMREAVLLAEHYGVDREKAAVAGLIHDCAKELSDIETLEYCKIHVIELNEIEKRHVFLMHGEVGAILAREKYEVRDESILKAIRYHTTGRSGMSMLDKIIFLADYIEPGRKHSEVDNVRKLAYVDIDRALVSAFDSIIKYVIDQKGLIHPDTIGARNTLYMLLSDNKTDL